jgi:hypothetical protein
MGLDASVACRCYQDGVVASPFPEHTVWDRDGYLGLDLPHQGHEAEYNRFGEWEGTACTHPGMCYREEGISNWPGYRMFQQALGEAGWERFPTLRAYLPERNGGILPAQAAPAALAELEAFKQAYRGTALALVEVETGRTIRTHIAAYEGVFIFGTEHEIGFDAQGLFVRASQKRHRECFRSRFFEQRHAFGPEEAVLTDLATGRRCAVSLGMIGSTSPATFRIEEQAQAAGAFAYILEPLARILQAAVETRNPVRWG